jgi:hypothetical protein
MPLSDEEKQRIRDEEMVRLQAREEYRAHRHWRTAVFWAVMIVVLFLMWNVVKTG